MEDLKRPPSDMRETLRRRGLRASLGGKFILLIAIVLFVTLGVGAAIDFRNQRALLLASLAEKANIQGELVASISKEAVLSQDYFALNRYMRDISRIEDIVYGAVVAPGGQYLTSYLNTDNAYIHQARARSGVTESAATLDTVSHNPDILVKRFPIEIDEKVVASVEIGADKARVTALAVSQLEYKLLFNLAIVLFLGVAIYIIFRISVIRPIQDLMAGAKRAAAGNLDETVRIHSDDELGQLTMLFNQMMARLKTSRAENLQVMVDMQELNRTLEERVMERTARLELAQRIAQMGHWDFDIGDNLFRGSRQVFALLGLSLDRPLRRNAVLHVVAPDDRRDLLRQFTHAIAKVKPFEAEFRVVLRGGEERILVATAEITINDVTGRARLFGILQDITQRSRAERTAQQALADKLSAVSANEAKSAFLANMSHEIRTPLTAIIGFAETMLEVEQEERDRDDATRTILDNGRHLLQVINEILDLSKIESRRLEIEILPTDIFVTLANVESVSGMLARTKGLSFNVEFQYPLPVRIQSDPTRLKQILLNLCSNAIKFTEKGGVTVHVSFDAGARLLRIAVVDTGIGLTAEQSGRLFAPFTQADSSTTRRFGGTGLGLYISKQLAELLGGSVAISSVEGLGTRVEVTVATGEVVASALIDGMENAASVVAPEQLVADVRSLEGRILLAEDSPDNQRLISFYVRKTGAEIDIAADGQAALEQALAGDYDLVLMDMQMPKMDGGEATSLLRQAGYGRPIVMLTANAFKEDRDRCAQAGCNDFLTKPIDRVEFYRVLNTYLRPRESFAAAVAETPAARLHREMEYEMRELAGDFVRELPERVKRMRSAQQRGDMSELGALVHKLKGVGATFGFPEVTRWAGEVEQQIRLGELSELRQRMDSLYQACDLAIESFSQRDDVAARR